MTFQKEILSEVLRDLERTRAVHEAELLARRQEAYERAPRIRQIDAELQSTAASVIRSALESGEDPAAAVAALRERNLTLQEERRRILQSLSLPGDYLSIRYDCPACSDQGYLGSRPCECLKARYVKKLTEQLSTVLPIQDQNFEAFRLDYYPETPDGRIGMSPRACMEMNFNKCKRYAEGFTRSSGNLLLYGSAGLGKTFLSTSIAKVVSERGFSVAYDTAINILASYETAKFGGGDLGEAKAAIRRCEAADLLIMDDLGTELRTAFTTSVFYHLLNTRLMSHRPMIINTNLLPDSYEEKYSPAIASRLLGEFAPLRVLGEDIRQRKRREAPRF